MSDGPYKSLNMRKSWKVVAARAEQPASATAEVAEAALLAVSRDWKMEVNPKLVTAMKNIFTCRDNSLQMVEVAIGQLETAMPLAAGSVFGLNAVECTAQLIREGRFGLDAFHEAISMAVKARTFAVARQMQEHYIRENHPEAGRLLKAKVCGAIGSISDADLAQTVVSRPKKGSARLTKKTGLDEGVGLCAMN